MATKQISQLTAATLADIDDSAVFAVDDADGSTRKLTLAELRGKLGDLTFTGNVTGSGPFGSIALTITNGVITFSKMANIATNHLIGRSTAGSGSPESIAVGSGLSMVAGVLSAAAPAAAAPSATLLTHRAFGGF